MIRNRESSEHYKWGHQCDGWRLINNEKQSIIHERMPPKTFEVRHFHNESHQFFFVLSGVMTIEINGKESKVSKHEGIEVLPQKAHQVFNRSDKDIEFLVISHPNTRNDRFVLRRSEN